jgi:hypothetical protein
MLRVSVLPQLLQKYKNDREDDRENNRENTIGRTTARTASSTAASNCEDDSENNCKINCKINCDNKIMSESTHRSSSCNITKLLDQFEPVYTIDG